MRKLFIILLIILSNFFELSRSQNSEFEILGDWLKNVPTFCEVVEKNGKSCEAYNVTSEDGYILTLFRIPGNASRPVFLMHGLLDSSDVYIAREENSLALSLARRGYDVWTGNNRGNRYSRHHVKLNPDKDEEFWDFTFHELGYYDLPPFIDLILNKTGQMNLSAIGHSEGTTIFYVLGATRPEYNDKIKILGCLAPVAYLQNVIGPIAALIKVAPAINFVLKTVDYEEVVGFYSFLKGLIRIICKIPGFGYNFCAILVIFPAFGPDPLQIQPDYFSTLINYYPAGTSRKNLVHYAQVGYRKEFARFDHGLIKNIASYGSLTPPKYELGKITMKVALYVGKNDYLATVEDVALLRPQLPNAVEYKLIDYDLWNHIDFIHGLFMPKYLFPLLMDLLAKYN